MVKCHYKVLGVPLDADSQTLRAAYKKLALRWHPDKNLDNVEKAKTEFQLVQQAFEVLSDPHERAWYDTHREAILKGGIGKDYKDDSVNLFPYFTSSCYQGFGDDEKGFYSVYREVFNRIFAEDVDFDPEENPDGLIPNFGKSDSSYEQVVHPFYAYWENYCTTKSFVWLDEFDVREAPNRRVMRLMEKENKKMREKAKRQRNEEIRQLVQFVRKRDKRVFEHRKRLEEKSKENAKKMKMHRLRQMEERKREIAEATEADWAKMQNIEQELQQIESNLAVEFADYSTEDDDEESSASGISHLLCVACNKVFKTEKSFANHESSKKHKENVFALHVPIDDDLDEDDHAVDQNWSNSDEEVQKKALQEGAVVEPCSSKKKAKNKKVLKPVEEHYTNGNTFGVDSPLDEESNGESFTKSSKLLRRRSRKKNSKVSMEAVAGEIEEQPSSEAISEEPQKSKETNEKHDKNLSKKQKRRKQHDTSNQDFSQGSKEISHACATCNSTFQSKNKLFAHLKSTGHSVNLSKSAAAGATEEEKSRSRSRNLKC